MKENVLDVLMYLFENYYMDDDSNLSPDRESLQVELLEAGFPYGEINKAFDWLDGLARYRKKDIATLPAARSMRLFTDDECVRLDTECRGFLLFLEQMDILDPPSRELIIERVMALDTDEIDITDLKWIILMVLFNEPGNEATCAWIEDLVFDNLAGSVH
jgi:Smg protein